VSRLLLSLVPLVLVYALVLASADPWDVAIGAVLAGVLVWGTRGFLFGERPAPVAGPLGRLVAFVPFAAATLRDVMRGTWDVALVVLHLRPLRHPGIVAVPIGERTRLGVAVTALVDTLSPGSCLIDVDWERRTMLIHVIEASDPDAIRAAHERFYRRYQRHVFP
jgi:multicomponent K+:H+ antiporter subunit E/multicomponent Na+:H+ antiporter subunit E